MRMTKPIAKLTNAVALASLIALAVYGYHDYQRRAVTRYIDSGQMFQTMQALGWTTNRMREFSVSLGNREVVIQAQAQTKDELERMLQFAARPGRPSVEHIVVRFQDTSYTRQ